MGSRPRKWVAAALLTDGDRVLFSRRRSDQPHPGQWEFPGGKLEPGETPEQAVARELKEELDADIEVGRIWEVLAHAYPDFDLVMLIYHCRLLSGATVRCREVEEISWTGIDGLDRFDILPADAPLIDRLRSEGVPCFVARNPPSSFDPEA